MTGDDADPGTSASDAVATWPIALALLTNKGDVLNVVNTGTPYLPLGSNTAPTGQGGTSFSDPSFTIQGTDADGNPSMTEMQWADDAVSEKYLAAGSGSSFVIVQGFHFNWAANSVGASAKHVTSRNHGTASIRVQYCYFQGTRLIGGAVVKDSSTFTTNGGDCRYNYFYNPSDTVQLIAPNGGSAYTTHNNVFVFDEPFHIGAQMVDLGSQAVGTTDLRVYNNTVLAYATADVMDGPFVIADDNNATGTPVIHIHSNVFANFQAAQSMLPVDGGAAAGEQAKYSQLIGYNIFVDPNANGWGTNGPYEQPFDPGDAASTDIYPTDVVSADPFHDKSTPWSWDFEGSGYSVTLPGDLRMDLHRTASQSGGVPGAIAESPPLGPNPSAPPSPIPVPAGDAAGIGPANPGVVLLTVDFFRHKNITHEAKTEFRPSKFLVSEAVKATHIVPAGGSVAMMLPQDMRYVILTSDADVVVTVNTEPMSLMAGGAILVAKVTVTSISVSNASTVNAATITYLGVD